MSGITAKSLITYLLKALFAGGLIFYMVSKGDLQFDLLYNNVPVPIIILGALILLFCIFVNNFRWTILLRSQGIACSAVDTFKISLIGLFFNYMFPSSVGGDVMRSFYISKENSGNRVKSVFSVVADRLVGMGSMLILALVTMLIYSDLVFSNSDLTSVFYSVLMVTFGFISFLTITFSKKVRAYFLNFSIFQKLPLKDKIASLYEAFHSYGEYKRVLLKGLALSLVSQILMTYFMILVGSYVGGDDLSLGTYFFAVPIGLIVMSLPIAPAGIGVGQFAFAYLFNAFSGVDTSVGQLVITAYQLTLILWGIIGAIFYIQRKSSTAKEEELLHE